MIISLFKSFVAGMADYIARHNSNYTLIETTLNYLLELNTGQSGIISVPAGLKEIFDRKGLIGIGSYSFDAGTLTGPSYNLAVAIGAYWSGTTGNFRSKSTASSLSMLGKATGTYYLYLDAAGNPAVSDSVQTDTIWQFAWNSSTHVVSAVVLYAGVSILLDGDDYADMLTSAARAKTFTKVADRLEEIEVLLSKTVQVLTPANSITINWALGGLARVLLDRATTTFTFTGAYDGQKLVLELLQDAEGGREIAFSAATIPGTDFTFPVPLSIADKRDFLGFIYSAGNTKYNYVSLARGY
jgi:hypothetical protein